MKIQNRPWKKIWIEGTTKENFEGLSDCNKCLCGVYLSEDLM